MSKQGWIAVDLDGTLARYEGWKGVAHIGAPIWPMVERVKGWLAEGREVRIFTARAYPGNSDSRRIEAANAVHHIERWCEDIFGRKLPVTCVKDYAMVEIWDDRAIRVVPNTGEPCCSQRESLCL